MSKLIYLIDAKLSILNKKFADLAIVLSSYIKVSNWCNIFNWPISLVN